MCEGWSLEIGTALRGSVVRQDHIEQPSTWLASVNAGYLGEYLDRESAMARVESGYRATHGHGAARLGAVSGGEGGAEKFAKLAEE